jgi:hypothetical protein
VARRQRVTKISNETEADPLLGGAFIGDYLEITANRGRAWVHHNANERHVALLGQGLPIPSRTTCAPLHRSFTGPHCR